MGWEVGGMFKREETSVYLIPIEVWKKPTQYCKASILQLKIKIYIYIFLRWVCSGKMFSHSVMSNSAISWTEACQASLSFTISWSLFKLMSIEAVMPPNHLILFCPFLLLPLILPRIQVFSSELVLCISRSKYCS